MRTAAAISVLMLAIPGAVGADVSSQLGVGYICGAEHASPVASLGAAVMMPGVGNGASPADTSNAQAQAWYDEGLNLYHAFNHEEAKAAFAKAASFDPSCALCEWGVALSLGPTLNYGVPPDQMALALGHAERAKTLLRPGDARAEGLIAALLLRYGKETPEAQRETLYGKAMDAMVRRYPADDEIANLAAHTLLTPARHDDYSGVARAEAILKTVLARKPDDTAAIHYYIHATEFAGHPADALPYAQRLAGLTPNASHLVHMAAHTLMHVGEYEQVATVDAEALKVDAEVKASRAYPGALSAQRYYTHNFSFGIGGALLSGDGPLALKFADHAALAFPTSLPSDRRATARSRALIAYGRFAPARALAVGEAADDPRIVRLYRHYARGEAFAAQRDLADLRKEAEAIAALGAEADKAKDTDDADIAAVSGDVLNGRAGLLAHKPTVAAEAFARAAARQEKAFPFSKRFDPPPWWYPVRRSLAAADLAAGKSADAAREAKASLAAWPKDALALRVLSLAETRQGQAAAARAHMAEARRAWRGDLKAMPLGLT